MHRSNGQGLTRAVCALLLSGLVSWASAAAERERAVIAGGVSRAYTLIAPDGPPASLPLVIVFHGGGQTAAKARGYTRFDEGALREKYVAVYPQGLGNNWNDGRQSAGLLGRPAARADDVEFTAQIIIQLTSEHVVDPARVFLVGASNGGMMAMYAGCRLEKLVAGIAPVVANQPTDWRCGASRLPALFIHGTQDEYMPYAGGQVAAKQSRVDLGRVLSVDSTITLYKEMNSCQGVKDSKRLDVFKGDKTIAVVTEYDCGEAPLKHILIEGGGHTWPGARVGVVAEFVLGPTSRELNATAEIWNFFKSLPPR